MTKAEPEETVKAVVLLKRVDTETSTGWLFLESADLLQSPSIFCCCLNVGGKASPDLMGATDDMTHSCWWLGVGQCLGFYQPVFVDILEYHAGKW